MRLLNTPRSVAVETEKDSGKGALVKAMHFNASST